ncbi:LamB/YcsF family protein [Cohnella boryungensis]|uniref:LamB/YcsF family protein n=1 Tax=Cohnella boryungensis TaxID=768479 RepID=A0ABV8SCL4_9BACL
MKIDLNADVGEGFGAYEWGSDDILLQTVSSANIACGFHAGDPHTMRKAVEACLAAGTAIGAHPGLPDRLGFGRREMAVSSEEAGDIVLYQIGALQGFVNALGGRLRHVKLHGALYHMAAKEEELALSVAGAVHALDPQLLLYGLPGSRLAEAALKLGLRYVAEGFTDRAYAEDGSLVPRRQPGAVLERTEEMVSQALSLARRGRFETLCVHGDTPQAAEHARKIAESLRAAGIAIAPPEATKTEFVE